MIYCSTERWIGKNWREIQIYLHEDSSFVWFSGSDQLGGLVLRDCPEMIAVGQVRRVRIPAGPGSDLIKNFTNHFHFLSRVDTLRPKDLMRSGPDLYERC